MAINISLKRGDDWDLTATADDESGNPVLDRFDNVTQADIHVRESADSEDIIVSFSTTDNSLSVSGATFTITKDAAETRLLPVGNYVYDIQCTKNGRVKTLADGNFEIVADVTRLT